MFVESLGTDYPEELRALPTRQLLELSQTNVTSDAKAGLRYAAAAYDKALEPEESSLDPTAAGEAAAKAYFRCEQLSRPREVAETWLERSLQALDVDEPSFQRQLVATLILAGRGHTLRWLKYGDGDSQLQDAAINDFAKAASTLRGLGTTVATDPYATMLDRTRATSEAVLQNGDALMASRIALRGIGRAVRSQRSVVAPAESIAAAKGRQHARFVGKQVTLNAAALVLAATKPLEKVGRIHKAVEDKRHRLAIRLLG